MSQDARRRLKELRNLFMAFLYFPMEDFTDTLDISGTSVGDRKVPRCKTESRP